MYVTKAGVHAIEGFMISVNICLLMVSLKGCPPCICGMCNVFDEELNDQSSVPRILVMLSLSILTELCITV